MSETVAREVEETVTAALSDPDAARALAAGRLATALSPGANWFAGAGAGAGAGTAPRPAAVTFAVALAFLFGYALTIGPILRASIALSTAIPLTLAADTVSITVMEIVENVIMLVIPGAMESGVTSWLFWGSLAVALAVAFVVTVPVNRWLIARGRGHAVVHQYHHAGH